MDYRIFRKPRLKNGKRTHRWYYYYLENGRQVQKSCKHCKTKAEAEAYVKRLPPRTSQTGTLIRTITETMYIPGGPHMNRRAELGRPLTASTLADNRKKIDRIIGQWGDKPLAALTVEEVGNYLFSLKLSGSWKRHFLAVLREVYAEAVWYKENLPCPHFPKFARNHRKADILTVEEVEKLFVAENFPSRETYLLFLCAVYGGLRIGEAAGLRPKQFVYEYKALVVDGFCRMNGERMRYNKKGTEEHPRTRAVPLPERVLEQMKEHIREEGIGEEEFCFRAEKDRGRAIRIPAAGKAFRVALKASGIEAGGRKLVPHSLRYTYVTKLLKKLPIEVVRKLAGHLSEGMTEYYNKRELDRTLKGLEGAGTAVSSLYT